jgi:hypothetical protein
MKGFCLLCLIIFSVSCFPQTSAIKLYAFRQTIVRGISTTYQEDEQGNKIEAKREIKNNVFVYLAYPPNIFLYPVEIWMDGQQYSVKPEPVQTPVIITYDNGAFAPETIVLVPKSSDTVTQLILSGNLPAKNARIKKTLADTNDLVLVYKLNGKFYSQTLKKIKGLRTAFMQ